MKLTDKQAIRVALDLAIMYEDSYIEAFRNPHGPGHMEGYDDVIQGARDRIAAFKRVQDRFFKRGSGRPASGGSLKALLSGEVL